MWMFPFKLKMMWMLLFMLKVIRMLPFKLKNDVIATFYVESVANVNL